MAVDLGASSGRVVGVRFDEGQVRLDGLHRFENSPVEREVEGERRWCWDLERLMRGIVEGIRVTAHAGPITSIAVDSWAVDYGLVDDRGELVAPVTAYRDERHRGPFSEVVDAVGAEALYARTGVQFQPFNTLYQLAADARDASRPLERASRLLMIPDLVANRLCGATVGERTNAGSTQCFDLESDSWIESLLTTVGAPVEIMPDVRRGECGPPVGTLRPELAAQAGVSPEVPIRLTASHDTAAAVAAAPLTGAGDAFISSGTWSLVGVECTKPIRSMDAMHANFTNEPGVFGTVRFLKNVSGLWLLQECRRAWAAEGRVYDWTALESMARKAVPLRTVFDPDASALAAPGDMPRRILAQVERSGEPAPRNEAEMVRAILDSVALATVRAIEAAQRLAGRTIERIVVVGGGAANRLLNELIADIGGRPVHLGHTEATAVGNAAVQRASMNGCDSLEALRSTLPPAVLAAVPGTDPRVVAGRIEAMTRLEHQQSQLQN